MFANCAITNTLQFIAFIKTTNVHDNVMNTTIHNDNIHRHKRRCCSRARDCFQNIVNIQISNNCSMSDVNCGSYGQYYICN